MKVLIIEGPGERPAGYVRVLASALKHLGHGVAVHPLGDVSGFWAGRRRVGRLADILFRNTAPDVVHVISSEPWVAEAFSGRGCPVVHTTAEQTSRTDWIAVPSRAAMDRVAGAGRGLDFRVGVLPYAVQVQPAPESVGHYALVKARPSDGAAAGWLKAAAARSPYVPLRERGDLRHARFVISLSTKADVWPAGVAEAMAGGRPVLAAWTGAAPEMVREGVTGFLCAPGDAASLARAMEYLWDHPEAAFRMGQVAREHAAHFLDPERHARTLLRWYMRAGASRLAV